MICNDKAIEEDQQERDIIGAGDAHGGPPPAGNGAGNVGVVCDSPTNCKRTNETREDSSGHNDGDMDKLDSCIVNARVANQRPSIGKKKAKMSAAKA